MHAKAGIEFEFELEFKCRIGNSRARGQQRSIEEEAARLRDGGPLRAEVQWRGSADEQAGGSGVRLAGGRQVGRRRAVVRGFHVDQLLDSALATATASSGAAAAGAAAILYHDAFRIPGSLPSFSMQYFFC